MHRGTVHDDGGSGVSGAPTGFIYVINDNESENDFKAPDKATFIPFKNDQGLQVGDFVTFKDEFVPSDPNGQRPRIRYAVNVLNVGPH